MGVVYEAEHRVLGQRVALKVLLPWRATSQDRERIMQEARVQAHLSHPNIVQLKTASLQGDQLGLVMEYVEGVNLGTVVERRGGLPVDEALRIFYPLLSAVGYMHEQGVIHRDLKPENVMVTARGEVKLTDLGLALLPESGVRLTATGDSAGGTPHFMSPEQVVGERDIDARADIYALGCILYELLCGQPPFPCGGASGPREEH